MPTSSPVAGAADWQHWAIGAHDLDPGDPMIEEFAISCDLRAGVASAVDDTAGVLYRGAGPGTSEYVVAGSHCGCVARA